MGRKDKNILVIKTDSLAAFVAAEPAFEAIRAAHPGATISLLTTETLQRIARAAPHFDQVAALPDLRDPAIRKGFVKQLRATKFDRVYDLAGDEQGRKVYAAMGFFKPKLFCAAPAAKPARKAASGISLPELGRLYASASFDAPERLPSFDWAIEARKDSANMQPSWYGISGSFGLLLPSIEPRRRWTVEGYIGVAREMVAADVMPVLVGGRELHEFGDEIAHEVPQLVDLTGKADHLQLVALAQEASFFVSDDAEEHHLVASVGCQGVIIVRGTGETALPEGLHVVRLNAADGMDTVSAEQTWQMINNMGLVPQNSGA